MVTTDNNGVSYGLLSYLTSGRLGVQTLQNSRDGTSATIPADHRGRRCAILIVGCNTAVPSIFMLSRTAVAGTVYQGDTIPASNITVNADSSITVTKPSGVSLYYRMIVMEW